MYYLYEIYSDLTKTVKYLYVTPDNYYVTQNLNNLQASSVNTLDSILIKEGSKKTTLLLERKHPITTKFLEINLPELFI